MSEPKFKSENYANFGGINSKTSKYVTEQTEFLDLVNLSFERTGALSKRPGTTLYLGATVLGRVGGLYEFNKLSGASQVIATANTNAYHVQSGSFSSIRSGLLDGGIFDFVTFVDRLFAANGQDMFVYDGTSARKYSLPPGLGSISGGGTGSGGMTGVFLYTYGYLNDRGYLGPSGATVSVNAAGHAGVIVSGFTTPSDYGVTAIAVYRTGAGGSDPFLIGYAASGASQFADANLSLQATGVNSNLWFTAAPKYLEIFENQLFLAGASTALSTVYYSELGEPEGVDLTNNFEVRTNDGDRITGMKTFNGVLYLFKENSFHKLLGDNPDNFTLSEISGEYGAISNRAIVVFEDYMAFLDKKGIVEFNGANIKVISNKIEPTLLNMNIDAARENAVGIHNRLRNELWFSVPCNGATLNNCVLVYDYILDAWTKYEGLNVSSFAIAKSRFSVPTALYGGYSGSILNFGSTLLGDNGQGFTCLLKSRFLSEGGKSSTRQYRRLYVDLDPVTGATAPITVNLYADYGSSAQISRTMYQTPFQSRIDFGIPAKSLSVELIQSSATLGFVVSGFTVEHREQRKV